MFKKVRLIRIWRRKLWAIFHVNALLQTQDTRSRTEGKNDMDEIFLKKVQLVGDNFEMFSW